MQQEQLAQREIRVPLYVPVQTSPVLKNSWAVNLSLSGIGLVATKMPGRELPLTGEDLRLEFALPDAGSRIHVQAQTQWSVDVGGHTDGQTDVALGMRFLNMSAEHKLALSEYFHAYRSHVLVAAATPDERKQIEHVLSDKVCLHFAENLNAFVEKLERGDIAAALVCGNQEQKAMDFVEQLAAELVPEAFAENLPLHDLTPRVVYAAAATPERLVEAFNQGKIFFQVPTTLPAHELEIGVLRACQEHGVRLEQRRVALALEQALHREDAAKPRSADEDKSHGNLIVQSNAMAEVVRTATVVSKHKTVVLLSGETGTGKGVIARLIHDNSDRNKEPFVVQDCGALTETLLESELFGHVKGAFTGAITSHPGLFVIADGGTIFLDEIENTSPGMQAKLLRVIETGEIRPVGGTRVRNVNVRVLAASNCDLHAEMEEGRFRPDLFFRLNTFPLAIPPLRSRQDDILPLAEYFLQRTGARTSSKNIGLSESAEQMLLTYQWPGNVRELKNLIERAVILCEGKEITAVHLPETLGTTSKNTLQTSEEGSLRSQMDGLEKEILSNALSKHNGILRRAAKELGLNPVTFARKAQKHGLV